MKNIFSKIFLILLAFVSFLTVAGQGVKDLRINEVLMINDSNYVDPYGVRSGWFEVFNTGYAMADIGGCYVTNDMKNPKKYCIPKGNPKTKIAARAYALFFAYNMGDRGIFHVNFSLNEKGFLALFDQSGTNLIDSVSYDITAQKSDLSFGKMENEPIATAKWHFDLEPTPEAINYVTVEKSRGEKHKETDKYGIIITVTTMSVVFLVLLTLALIFTQTGRYFKRKSEEAKTQGKLKLFTQTRKYTKRTGNQIRKIVTKENTQEPENEPVTQNATDTNELDMVAIATALYLHFDNQHETEQTGFWLDRPLNQQTAWTAKNILFKKSPIRK
jgi:Na+-transporting methylmalonyl-CoA/oxaloacetate decarboxylase gamma subunit